MGPHTMWVNHNQASDMNAPPPAVCNRCGQMHWAQFPCPQPQPGAVANPATHKPSSPSAQGTEWSAALLQLLQQQQEGAANLRLNHHAPNPFASQPAPPNHNGWPRDDHYGSSMGSVPSGTQSGSSRKPYGHTGFRCQSVRQGHAGHIPVRRPQHPHGQRRRHQRTSGNR